MKTSYDGNIVTDPRVQSIKEMADMCHAFGCLPSQLRKENTIDVRRIGSALLYKRFKEDPISRMMGGKQ